MFSVIIFYYTFATLILVLVVPIIQVEKKNDYVYMDKVCLVLNFAIWYVISFQSSFTVLQIAFAIGNMLD